MLQPALHLCVRGQAPDGLIQAGAEVVTPACNGILTDMLINPNIQDSTACPPHYLELPIGRGGQALGQNAQSVGERAISLKLARRSASSLARVSSSALCCCRVSECWRWAS